MTKVLFYHVTRSALDQVAASLLPRWLGQGWRVMVRGDVDTLARLDEKLWVDPADGFLPHGLAGGAQDADQPVLLGAGAAVNGARVVLLYPGLAVDLTEAAGLERVAVLFDGGDQAQVAAARLEWKAVTGAGLAAEYWSEESGRWEKKAG